jgi:exopolysaccharide production protein ExoY
VQSPPNFMPFDVQHRKLFGTNVAAQHCAGFTGTKKGQSMNATSYLAKALPSTPPAHSRAFARDNMWMRINQWCAFLLLVLLSPLLLLIVFLIWRRDGMPVLFAHYRVGCDGKLFKCLKFRTMLRNSEQLLANLLRDDPIAREEWARDQKLSNDPRITAVGQFLRRSSLDELPQLVNVLRGEMRLVGPRPITVGELGRYGAARWHYLSVHPGITGLWQVSGRNNTTYDERVQLDQEYVEGRSVALDMRILLKTVRVVLMREGAK